jgi:hypothetical protein
MTLEALAFALLIGVQFLTVIVVSSKWARSCHDARPQADRDQALELRSQASRTQQAADGPVVTSRGAVSRDQRDFVHRQGNTNPQQVPIN